MLTALCPMQSSRARSKKVMIHEPYSALGHKWHEPAHLLAGISESKSKHCNDMCYKTRRGSNLLCPVKIHFTSEPTMKCCGR